MLNNIDILKTASAMARYAATRHTVISENIANADTGNYKAKDLEPFSDAYARMSDAKGAGVNKAADLSAFRAQEVQTPGVASPNGNTVSLEDQLMRSIEAQQDHQAAISIYKKTIDLLRMSLGRGS